MSWIETIPYEESSGTLRAVYRRVSGPNGHIDNIMALHSLRPHTLDGHMRLYKNVLHHRANTLPEWWLETIGTYVSLLNRCEYCVEHHYTGLKRLLETVNEDWNARAGAIRASLETMARHEACFDADAGGPFNTMQLRVLEYVRTLTLRPVDISENHLNELRSHGLTDGEILEINQVSAYFAYANRTVLGLGCKLDGDILGLSPDDSSDPDNWEHR